MFDPFVAEDVHDDIVVVLPVDEGGFSSSSDFFEADFFVGLLRFRVEVEGEEFYSVQVQRVECEVEDYACGFLSVSFASVLWVVYADSEHGGPAYPVDVEQGYTAYELVFCSKLDGECEAFLLLAFFPCVSDPFFFVASALWASVCAADAVSQVHVVPVFHDFV